VSFARSIILAHFERASTKTTQPVVKTTVPSGGEYAGSNPAALIQNQRVV
jgi:hypothetical protein